MWPAYTPRVEVVLGGLAGLTTGVLGSLLAACLQAVGRLFRDRRRARRGDAALSEPLFTPYWVLFALLGFIAGVSWTWRLQGTWMTGAIAGTGVPALASLIFIAWAAAQVRR